MRKNGWCPDVRLKCRMYCLEDLTLCLLRLSLLLHLTNKPTQVCCVQNQITDGVRRQVIWGFSDGAPQAFKGIEPNAILAGERCLGLLLKNYPLPQKVGGRDLGWGCPLGTGPFLVFKNFFLSNASKSWLKSLAVPWHGEYKCWQSSKYNFPGVLPLSFQ